MEEAPRPRFAVTAGLPVAEGGRKPELRLLIHLVEQAAASPCDIKRSDSGTLVVTIEADDESEAEESVRVAMRVLHFDSPIISVERQE
jgi:hypothetical protein